MSKNTGLINNIRNYGEGRLDSKNYEKSIVDELVNFSPFIRMVVLDVIFDPNNDYYDETKKDYWTSLGVANIDWLESLPRNTIVAKKVGEESAPLFVFPFFPSHISLPCKPGEFVWAFFENSPSLDVSGLQAYWLCRISEPHVVDDVNHTHAPRVFEPTLFPTSINNFEENNETIHELRNGPVIISKIEEKEERVTSAEGVVLKGEKEDIFESLVTDTDAAKLMSYEAIPRYRKRPGDIALEGTNNTLIVLGTDRSGAAAEYSNPELEEDIAKRERIALYPADHFREAAGSIDLVVGRGQTPETFGTEASTIRITKNSEDEKVEIKKELDKSYSKMLEKEGNPDFKNDRSRIVISQRTKTDRKFDLDQHNDHFLNPKVKDSDEGDAAIVIKSDKVRIIARSDAQILVTNFAEETSPVGKKIKKDSEDISEWASITIKSSGDIVFKPSSKGYIKLGDDTADKAILCTDKPAIMQEGRVSYKPGLITTGASVVGTGNSGQGTFAKKVLVK